MGMFSYWAQVFILPKCVIKDVIKCCRSFLWGSGGGKKYTPVSWETLCLPKPEGGQGVLNLEIWNIALIARLLWDIARKADCLWVEWVNQIYLKGKVMWNYHPTCQTSWYWRKLMKVKDSMTAGYDTITSTWLMGGEFYTAMSGHNWLRPKAPVVKWYDIIWNKRRIPKCSFISWSAIQNRLLTKEIMDHFGIPNEGVCVLCARQAETIHHLFFECDFVRYIWINCLKELCGETVSCWQWIDWQDWMVQKNGVEQMKIALITTIVIYNCRIERN